MPTPLGIVIESVQYTEGAEPVLVQFSAVSRTGIFARTSLCHMTQAALVARIPAGLGVGDRWGGDEVSAELLAYLADNGITAEVVEGEA